MKEKKLFINLDDIHFNFRTIDGYNMPFNAVISAREAGKSTRLWLDKVYKPFILSGRPSIVLRRQINDITEAYINDISEVINKFIEKPIKFNFKKGSIKEGIVDVYIGDKLFIRLIALHNPVSRIKSLIIRNLQCIVFDEFICNPKFKEKYLPDEATRFKEIFNTFQRETTGLKCYFMGNPYSLYNPYFVWWGVDTKKLRRGTIQHGKNWVVQCYDLSQELKDFILARNPLYEFDDAYTRYGFDGLNVNDQNINLDTLHDNFYLKFVFYIEGKYIGVYSNRYWQEGENKYFCQFIDSFSARRTSYCFDFGDLLEGSLLMSNDERTKFSHFKGAMRRRAVAFESIECYYLIEEIYANL